MSKVTCDLTITLDGYAAGHHQTEERPFGDDGGDGWGDRLHAWYADKEENAKEIGRMTTARRVRDGPQHVRSRAGRLGPGVEAAGGATARRTTHRCSCSPTTRATRMRWRAAPRSTS